MWTNKAAAFALIIAGMLLTGDVARTQNPPASLPDSDGWLVEFEPWVTEASKQSVRQMLGATSAVALKNAGDGQLEMIRIPARADLVAMGDQLRNTAFVRYAEPNWKYTHDATSNDFYYTNGSLWGMYGDATSPADQFGSQAGEAWAAGVTGSPNVYIAVIDEGIDVNHPDLAGNIWTNPFDPVDGIDNDGNGYVDDVHGWDFVSNDNSVFDGTEDDHGTHVAGTIGAVGGNGTGVVGVNWDVTIIPAKFLGPGGGFSSDAVEALAYITDLKQRHGLNIIATNNSWGGTGYSQALHDAIIRAAKAGVLFVASAGNDNSDNDLLPTYPANLSTLVSTSTETAASYEAVTSVASIDASGGRSSFSNYGATTVDLGAPGGGIVSTVPGNRYDSYGGTSMAAPHVTGAAALYFSANPTATPEQLRTAILESAIATPTASMSGITVTGGRLNISAMPPLPPAMQAISVTPDSGQGGSQTFVLAYSDSRGVTADLTSARLRIGATNVSTGTCTVDYNAVTGLVRMQDNAGTWGAGVPFGSGTLSNSQCTLNLAQSSATPNGTDLSMTLHLSFSASFAGAKSVYMNAIGSGGTTTGWQTRGTWNVVSDLGAVSVAPNDGSGPTQAFVLAYSDSFGATTDLKGARLRIGASDAATATSTCTIEYNATTASVRMQDNAGNWGAPAAFGSGTLANSQCTLNLALSSATPNGTSLSLTLSLTFSAAFAGPKNVFMLASGASGTSTGWVTRGTWSVAGTIAATSVTPGSATGSTHDFVLAYSDSFGVSADLTAARLRVGATNVSAGTCTIEYNAVTALVRMQDNVGTWGAPVPFGSGTLSNSQCTVNLAQSSATPNGTDLSVTLRLTFSGSFSGLKNLYMQAASAGGSKTGWVLRGTWTVPTPVVSAISISPDNSSGSTQTFALAYSDSFGITADLKVAKVRFAGDDGLNCNVDYNGITGLVRIKGDTGTPGPWTPLGSGTLANSQCVVDLALSSAAPSGTDLTVTLHITFTASFAGNRAVSLRAKSISGPMTDWISRGTWIVP